MEAERTLSSREVFAGKLLRLRVDDVALKDGRVTQREIVEHPGAVAILAFTDGGEIVLVRQYRKAAERLTLEIPAGTLGRSEEPFACAVRELKEETGFAAGTFSRLCSFYTAVGFCTEVLHLFAASDLVAGDQAFEDDEDIEVMSMPVPEALAKIRDGEIVDSKTIAAVFWAQLYQLGDQPALALAETVA